MSRDENTNNESFFKTFCRFLSLRSASCKLHLTSTFQLFNTYFYFDKSKLLIICSCVRTTIFEIAVSIFTAKCGLMCSFVSVFFLLRKFFLPLEILATLNLKLRRTRSRLNSCLNNDFIRNCYVLLSFYGRQLVKLKDQT